MSGRKRILFVDDEASLLHGLRDALRRQRNVWEMVFVTSGAEALRALAQQPFDLMVTDMRMPGMDGVELLTAVCERHPGTARAVLTGHAEREQITRACSLAQQILAKPCDGTTLQAALTRLLAAHAQARTDRVRELVGMVTALPSMHDAHASLMAAARSPTSRVEDVVAILETDPALTARVLHMSNAACFGADGPPRTVMAAVRFLGMRQVTGLVLLARTFDMIAGLQQKPAFDAAGWHQHALLCAGLARTLCEDSAAADDAYVAGLLHDIGQVVLLIGCPAEHARATHMAQASSTPLREAEQHVAGVAHDELGARLLAMWGLVDAVTEAVARHHDEPSAAGDTSLSGEVRQVVAAVRLAHRITEQLVDVPGDTNARHYWLRQHTELQALGEARLERLAAVVAQYAPRQRPADSRPPLEDEDVKLAG